MINNKIIDTYTNPLLPGSFSGLSGFIKNNKQYRNSRFAKSTLQSIPAYTLHKSIKYSFKRTKTLVQGIDDEWQVDLVDVSNISGSNSKFKFILTCIDVFSKFAWAIPILNKSAASSTEAFKLILKSGRLPNDIYSDDGNEFKGECKKFLEAKGIQIYVSTTKVKAAVVERFNRTLKDKMYRYFTFKKDVEKTTNLYNKRYLEVLPKLIQAYNNTYHRSIKMTPNQVNEKNKDDVFFNLYGYKSNEGDESLVKIRFKPGMYVRLVKSKNIFEKGYTASWSKNIFIIDKVYAQIPILYQVKNMDTGLIEGTYYAEELQNVQLPFDTFEVLEESDKTLKVKKLNSEESNTEIVDKNNFLKERYSLRKR